MLEVEIQGFLEACIASCMNRFWDNSNEVLFSLFWGRGFSSNECLQHISLGISQCSQEKCFCYLTTVRDNRSKQTNRKAWVEPWDFLFSRLWAGCHFTIGEALCTSVFLSWRCFNLLNTAVCFLIMLEKNVFILTVCFSDLPILFPFWFGLKRNPPITAFPNYLYHAFSILCGTFCFLPVCTTTHLYVRGI